MCCKHATKNGGNREKIDLDAHPIFVILSPTGFPNAEMLQRNRVFRDVFEKYLLFFRKNGKTPLAGTFLAWYIEREPG